jgi:hypothetical protein
VIAAEFLPGEVLKNLALRVNTLFSGLRHRWTIPQVVADDFLKPTGMLAIMPLCVLLSCVAAFVIARTKRGTEQVKEL